MAREERQFYNDIIIAAKDCLADPSSKEPFAPSITHITFVGNGFVKNTIQYDSKSKHSKRRQTVN